MSNRIMVKGMLAVAASLMFVLGIGAWETAAEANEYDWGCIAEWQEASDAGTATQPLAVACFGAVVNTVNYSARDYACQCMLRRRKRRMATRTNAPRSALHGQLGMRWHMGG